MNYPSQTAGDQLLNPLVDFRRALKCLLHSWGSTLKPPGRLLRSLSIMARLAGDQLLNPLVDFRSASD